MTSVMSRQESGDRQIARSEPDVVIVVVLDVVDGLTEDASSTNDEVAVGVRVPDVAVENADVAMVPVVVVKGLPWSTWAASLKVAVVKPFGFNATPSLMTKGGNS